MKQVLDVLAAVLLCATLQGEAAGIIDHEAIAGITNAPQQVMDKVGLLRWFFSHASVGGNMITGMNVLRQGDTNRYRLAIYNYDGDNSDSAYHGAIATAGTPGQADYRAVVGPATANGFIYECQRGNPAWDNKLTCFSNSVALSGWRYPRMNVVMDKFCWIDPDANPSSYCLALGALEASYPETLFVYLTMPLTTETAGTDNDARNAFNRYVRSYCATNHKWLLDIADVEAWTTNWVQDTYVSGTVTNQRMVGAYAVNAGGDFHLNVRGRRQTALAWYALAAALFQQDSDTDGVTDGDELIAGTRPKDPASRFRFAGTAGNGTTVAFQWASSSNRSYSLQSASNLMAGFGWSQVTGGLAATPPLNGHTVNVGTADALFYRTVVEQ